MQLGLNVDPPTTGERAFSASDASLQILFLLTRQPCLASVEEDAPAATLICQDGLVSMGRSPFFEKRGKWRRVREGELGGEEGGLQSRCKVKNSGHYTRSTCLATGYRE